VTVVRIIEPGEHVDGGGKKHEACARVEEEEGYVRVVLAVLDPEGFEGASGDGGGEGDRALEAGREGTGGVGPRGAN